MRAHLLAILALAACGVSRPPDVSWSPDSGAPAGDSADAGEASDASAPDGGQEDAGVSDDAGVDDAGVADAGLPDAGVETAGHRHLYTLSHAPIPGPYPTALVHLASGFRSDGPLHLVVHFHGWHNCLANDAESYDSPCTAGAPARYAHKLIEQLDATAANAALVTIECAYDQATGADGNLSQAGYFRAIIDELLPHIGALAGRSYSESDLGAMVLSTHSGGYQAVADILDHGGLTPLVTGVVLLDSLYGDMAQYEAWLKGDLAHHRMAVIYTDGGGTEANSQSLATSVSGWLAAAGLPSSMLVDHRTLDALPDAAFSAPLVFSRTALAHDQTAATYFGLLTALDVPQQ
jgi:hypothetical protein